MGCICNVCCDAICDSNAQRLTRPCSLVLSFALLVIFALGVVAAQGYLKGVTAAGGVLMIALSVIGLGFTAIFSFNPHRRPADGLNSWF